MHFVVDDDDDNDDSQSIGSDVKSFFGSLIASDNDLTDEEFAEGEVSENEKGSDLSDDETLARTDLTSVTENDLNSKETGVDSSEDDEDEEINSISKNLNEMRFLNIKEKLNEYRKLALEPHVASDEAKEQVAAALSKHRNPVSCSICKALMKNERGVKLHIAKKHS